MSNLRDYWISWMNFQIAHWHHQPGLSNNCHPASNEQCCLRSSSGWRGYSLSHRKRRWKHHSTDLCLHLPHSHLLLTTPPKNRVDSSWHDDCSCPLHRECWYSHPVQYHGDQTADYSSNLRCLKYTWLVQLRAIHYAWITLYGWSKNVLKQQKQENTRYRRCAWKTSSYEWPFPTSSIEVPPACLHKKILISMTSHLQNNSGVCVSRISFSSCLTPWFTCSVGWATQQWPLHHTQEEHRWRWPRSSRCIEANIYHQWVDRHSTCRDVGLCRATHFFFLFVGGDRWWSSTTPKLGNEPAVFYARKQQISDDQLGIDTHSDRVFTLHVMDPRRRSFPMNNSSYPTSSWW